MSKKTVGFVIKKMSDFRESALCNSIAIINSTENRGMSFNRDIYAKVAHDFLVISR